MSTGQNAPLDENSRQGLYGLSSANDGTRVDAWVNPITHALLIDDAGGGSGTVTEVDTGTGLTGGPITTTGTISLDSKLAPLDTLGSAGQSVRVNAGATALEYYTPSTGAPGGSNTQVQYNNSSAFGGISGVTTDGTALTIASGDLKLSGASSGTAVLNAPSTGGGTLTLPSGTDTILGAASTATLTNKTFDTAGTGNVLKINGTGISAVTGTGFVVLASSPTVALASASSAVTQSAGDNSTAVATDAFVTTAIANAIAGNNPAVAVQAATTSASNTSGFTYSNGVSGVGATLTQNSAAIYTVDGYTFTTIGQRLLVKNDTHTSPGSVTAGTFNGVYTCTVVGTAIIPAVFTRALDYDTTTDINNTGTIPVINGTVNAQTSWLNTTVLTAVGSGTGNNLAYIQFSYSPTTIIPPSLGGTGIANNAANTLTYSGNFGITETLTATTSVTFPTSGTLVSSVTTGNGVSATNTAGALAFTLGAITPSTVNGNTLTTGSSTYTGTAAATYTFPGASATIAGLGTTQTFTGQDNFNNFIDVNNAVSVSSNAGTVPVTFRLNTFTNSSAATMAITMATSSAVDGQMTIVRIYDFSAVAQTIGWTNTENSTESVPLTSNGSTTLPLTVGFMYNTQTSKWRCIASA